MRADTREMEQQAPASQRVGTSDVLYENKY